MKLPVCLIALSILVVPLAGFSAPKSKPASSQPITLSIADIYPGKAELLKLAAKMPSDADQMRDTEQYARDYERFRRALQVVTPAVATWAEADRTKVQSVPAP